MAEVFDKIEGENGEGEKILTREIFRELMVDPKAVAMLHVLMLTRHTSYVGVPTIWRTICLAKDQTNPSS